MLNILVSPRAPGGHCDLPSTQDGIWVGDLPCLQPLSSCCEPGPRPAPLCSPEPSANSNFSQRVLQPLAVRGQALSEVIHLSLLLSFLGAAVHLL